MAPGRDGQCILTGLMVIGDFILVSGFTFNRLVKSWFSGVWGGGILTFALEMVLIS